MIFQVLAISQIITPFQCHWSCVRRWYYCYHEGLRNGIVK